MKRGCGTAVLALMGLVAAVGLLPAPAVAQAPRLDSMRSALFEVERGTTIRVASEAGTVEGTLTRLDSDALILGPGTDTTHDLTAIDTLWVRGRATRKGAVIGGITGGIGGALFGGFFGLLTDALCEFDCPDGDVLHYAGWVAGTSLVGGIGGAGVGALVGSAFPRWHRRFP